MSSVSSVSSTAPSTSPLLPPNTSSGGTTDGSSNTTSVMLFGFIIVFVVVIGAFLVGGILWHRIRMRRHAEMMGMLQYDGHTGGYKIRGPPPLYEIWADDEKLDGKGEWTTLAPLSVTVEHHAQISSTDPVPRPQQHRGWLHPFRIHDTLVSSSADTTAVESSPTAHVSFLVAMPSPTRRFTKDVRSSVASDTSSVQPWSLSGEYSLGTYHTPFYEGASP